VSRRCGLPRLHYRSIDSTNRRARELAGAGAPDGTLVTASEQTAGRGRQGRTWTAAPGRALLCSLVVRDPPRLLPLAAGVAVAETVDAVAGGGGGGSLVKWPNDVLVDGRKVAGILVEGRPQEGWAALGIGLNVALRAEDFPPELADTAATLGLQAEEVEPVLARMLESLSLWIAADADAVLAAVRARDALLDQPLRWAGGSGRGGGIDGDGRLVVMTDSGRVQLDAGEVHLGRAG
jgi:BirA family transcriptional regulator, biotin operon repressor / biotin---[acetyl-CoA-carboxylase] ligase